MRSTLQMTTKVNIQVNSENPAKPDMFKSTGTWFNKHTSRHKMISASSPKLPPYSKNWALWFSYLCLAHKYIFVDSVIGPSPLAMLGRWCSSAARHDTQDDKCVQSVPPLSVFLTPSVCTSYAHVALTIIKELQFAKRLRVCSVSSSSHWTPFRRQFVRNINN